MRLLVSTVRFVSDSPFAADVTKRPSTSFALFLQAYLLLIRFDFFLACGDFAKLYDKVRGSKTGENKVDPGHIARICAAVDLASIWYYKQILCLQRSAATTCLLRRFGVSAQMVIGVQQLPFKAHAWVEVNGNVVNDKPYIRAMYEVLDCC